MNQPENDKIKNNPSFAKLEKDFTGMLAISRIVDFLEKLGIRHDKISEAMKSVPGLAQQFEILLTTPDKFNQHFSRRGWVAYEGMNFDLMKEAVALADNGELDLAEQRLVEHYNEKLIKQMLIVMRNIPEFRPRERLLLKALEDFIAERYYACIPIILANIDGLVSDIEQKGFFTEGANLTAWDSIAAHNSGLQQLAQLFGKIRRKTTTETITIPYRHGILHGHDLGYDNKIVAVKAWATLFALRDWIIALRKPKPEPKPQTSLWETIKQTQETQKEIDRLRTWKPRNLSVGSDILATGQPQDFTEFSPERA